MRTFLLLSTLLLAGCVTVVVPPTSPSVQTPPPSSSVVPGGTVETCRPYQAPGRRRIPHAPIIHDNEGEYVKHLENVAEYLARHIGELREYIDDEHALEDRALREHLKSCPQ